MHVMMILCRDKLLLGSNAYTITKSNIKYCVQSIDRYMLTAKPKLLSQQGIWLLQMCDCPSIAILSIGHTLHTTKWGASLHPGALHIASKSA